MSAKDVIAIVDPFSSGTQLARDVKARGHDCIMVQSTAEIPALYRSSFNADSFDFIVHYQGDLDQTCDVLRGRQVRHVLAGSEVGVELADQLSERLGLVTNGTRLSSARRNKRSMLNVLRDRGIRIPNSFSSRRWDAIEDWIRRHDRWPVVVKPLCSSASDGVRRCADRDEVHAAFRDIIDRQDVFGSTNEEALVQEYITGTEYAVDTVSCAGRHKPVAYWQYSATAIDDAFLGKKSLQLIRHTASLDNRLFPYVVSVLDALEIANGPAHCELILSDTGPVIVEIGARPNGGNNPLLARICGATDQLSLTLDSYLEPEKFLRQADRREETPRSAIRVFLTPSPQGRLKSPPHFEPVKRLESFHDLRFSAKPGQTLARIAGWVLLVHEDTEVLHRDLQELQTMEQNGLYDVEVMG
ncbi:MAG: ATP-grasp domain-containing protein [Planctomycetales bacterium]|nr:ATP-grasp domain-containing protein [Planctomycetales bacterium]